MLGYAILGAGALLIWVASTGKADKLFQALNVQLPGNSSGAANSATGPSSGITHPVDTSSGDSGSHMGIDQNGDIVSINKTYGAMSDAEKDAANAFANKFPSGA